MIPLETKQSGGKLLPHPDLRRREGVVFLGETSHSIQRGIKIGTCNVRSLYRAGSLKVDGWIILGWISRKWDVGIWTGLG